MLPEPRCRVRPDAGTCQEEGDWEVSFGGRRVSESSSESVFNGLNVLVAFGIHNGV